VASSPTHSARLEITDDLPPVWSTTSWTGQPTDEDIDAFCAAAAAVLSDSRPSPTTGQA
jgi:hypothetical protein